MEKARKKRTILFLRDCPLSSVSEHSLHANVCTNSLEFSMGNKELHVNSEAVGKMFHASGCFQMFCVHHDSTKTKG